MAQPTAQLDVWVESEAKLSLSPKVAAGMQDASSAHPASRKTRQMVVNYECDKHAKVLFERFYQEEKNALQRPPPAHKS
jgi:hypothetical protein